MVLFLPTELSLEKLRHRLSLFFRRLAAVVLLFFTSGFTCLHSCLTNAQRWWFISADRTREARCCSFWFVWLFRDHLIYEREKKKKNVSEFSPRSNQIALCDRLTFNQKWRSLPTPALRPALKVFFKIAVWPQHRGGPHAPESNPTPYLCWHS